MTDLKLIQWAKDKYPPIDLNSHHNDVYKLINAYNELQADNERLREALRNLFDDTKGHYEASDEGTENAIHQQAKAALQNK